MNILKTAKPAQNEQEWNFLYTVKFLHQNILFDSKNKASSNPDIAAQLHIKLIEKLRSRSELKQIPGSDVFYGQILHQNIDLVFLHEIGAIKTALSQLRKKNLNEMTQIADILRQSVILEGSSRSLSPNEIYTICLQIFSFQADIFGLCPSGSTRNTFHQVSNNPHSQKLFAKTYFNMSAQTSYGFHMLALETQISFIEDPFQAHQEYGDRKLASIYHSNFPSYKAGILNQIHFLTTNQPHNVQGSIEAPERKAYLWRLASVIHFLLSEENPEQKAQILNMPLQKTEREIQFPLTSDPKATVGSALNNIMQNLNPADFSPADIEQLAEYGIQL